MIVNERSREIEFWKILMYSISASPFLSFKQQQKIVRGPVTTTNERQIELQEKRTSSFVPDWSY